jgi:hypothetical protein
MNYQDHVDYFKYSLLCLIEEFKRLYKKTSCRHDYIYQGEHKGYQIHVCSKCHKVLANEC